MGVRRWIVGFRRVMCGGFLVFEGGDDVGFGFVIVDAGFMYFSIRPGRVDEPEFCALARVYELGADKDGTVGEQGQERRESPPGSGGGCGAGIGGGEEGGLVVVKVESGEGDSPGETAGCQLRCGGDGLT